MKPLRRSTQRPEPPLLDEPGGRSVALLAHLHDPDGVAGWLSELTGDHVTVLVIGSLRELDPAQVTSALGLDPGQSAVHVEATPNRSRLVRAAAANGPFDMIVDLLPTAGVPERTADHFDLFRHLFFHLAHLGSYVVDRRSEARRPHPTESRKWQSLEAAVVSRETPSAARPVDKLVKQVRAVTTTSDLLIVRKVGHNVYKMREKQLRGLTARREPDLSVTFLERRPKGSFAHSALVESYGAPPDDGWPPRLDYPPTSVRRYEGDLVSAGGMRLLTGNTILPDSFRWHLAPVLNHPGITSVTPALGRVNRRLLSPENALPGSYYFLDCIHPGHFGHLTTEVLSRLWGWDVAKREDPELKALFHVRPRPGKRGALERALFTAYGIAEADLVAVQGPVRLESVTSATPLWHNATPHYAHPDIEQTWSRMTTGLLQGAPPGPHERIFVSRGSAFTNRRGCRNQQEVERFFADRGFHILYPEELDLQEQVAIFAGARVVAGFGGSAMFNLMHARRLEHVVVLSHDGYNARNEQLFASVLGAKLHYFWSPADIPSPDGRRTRESFRSSWSFDFDGLRGDLERVLRFD